MKKLLMVCLLAVGLAGCDAETQDLSASFKIPKELADKDCKMYRMQGSGTTVYVMHCPGATTSTSHGSKNRVNATTVDETYVGDRYE